MHQPFFSGLQPTLNIAHRGGACLYPENTIHAFRQSIETHGAHMIETDVHMTADEEVVVFHDERLERTTNGRGFIRDSSWFDVKTLDAGYRFSPNDDGAYPFRSCGHHIPRFEDVLTQFPDAKFNVDLKARDPRLVTEVAKIIKSMAAESRVCVGSKYDEIGEYLVDALPESVHFYPKQALMECMGAIMGGLRPADSPYTILDIPFRYQGLELVSPDMLDLTNAAGLWVNVWTVDEEPEMLRLVKMGVGGIMTDRPDRLTAVLNRSSLGH